MEKERGWSPYPVPCTLSGTLGVYLYKIPCNILKLKWLEQPGKPVVKVLLPKNLASGLKSGLLLRGITKGLDKIVDLDLRKKVIILESMPGEKEVVAVEDLNKALNLGLLGKLILGHVLSELLWALLDAKNNAMWVLALLGAVVGSKDDNLHTCVATIEDNTHATGLNES